MHGVGLVASFAAAAQAGHRTRLQKAPALLRDGPNTVPTLRSPGVVLRNFALVHATQKPCFAC
jgi:hypothetical protein